MQTQDVQQADSTTSTAQPAAPANRIWHILRSYILWSYERGTIHYDVMVTLILVFVFFSPLVIGFNDKPVEHSPHRTEVVVAPDEHGGLVYRIEGSAVHAGTLEEQQLELMRIIEPISGEVTVDRVEPMRDRTGHITSYNVWASRH